MIAANKIVSQNFENNFKGLKQELIIGILNNPKRT